MTHAPASAAEVATAAAGEATLARPDARREARPVHRLIAAILFGIVTYDANLLVITPADAPRDPPLSPPEALR